MYKFKVYNMMVWLHVFNEMIQTIGLVTIHHLIDIIKRKEKISPCDEILRIYLLYNFPMCIYITNSNVNYSLHVVHCIPSTYSS